MKQAYLLKGQPEEWTRYHQQGIFQYNYHILIRKGVAALDIWIIRQGKEKIYKGKKVILTLDFVTGHFILKKKKKM